MSSDKTADIALDLTRLAVEKTKVGAHEKPLRYTFNGVEVTRDVAEQRLERVMLEESERIARESEFGGIEHHFDPPKGDKVGVSLRGHA